MAYTKRYGAGFNDLGVSGATPVDSQFLGNVETSLLRLDAVDPTVDGQVMQWVSASSRFGPALLLNKNIDPTAAIAKSKLALTNSIVDADIAAGAAIAGSKLNLNNVLQQPTHFAAGSKVTVSLWSGGPPGSPSDGDVWIATAPDTGNLATTDGTRWQFQYNATSGSAYKWECIGGTPIEKFSTTADAGTAGAWVQDARTQVAGLRAGDYQTRYWAILNNTSGSASNDIEIGTGPTSGAAPVGIGAFDIGATALPAAERRVIYVESPTNTLAASSTITGFWYGGLVAVAINSRNLMVMPKRVA